jgi:LysR family cyn operon transcriptional activator
MLLLVRPAHPLAGQTRLPMRQLEGMPLALLPRSFATRRLIDDNLRLAGVTPLVRVEMESVEALVGVCRYSDLASIVPERAALQAPDLHTLELTEPQMVRHAGLLWRRGASRSAAARAFAALLRAMPLDLRATEPPAPATPAA